MRRLSLALTLAALAMTGCTPTGEDQGTTAADPTDSSRPGTATTDDITATTSSIPAINGTTSDRPLAPEFTLELGDGGSYTLSEGARPVYLVFWAEW